MFAVNSDSDCNEHFAFDFNFLFGDFHMRPTAKIERKLSEWKRPTNWLFCDFLIARKYSLGVLRVVESQFVVFLEEKSKQ